MTPLVDANLLIWAHHAHFPRHPAARAWWGRLLSETPLVGLPWPSILAFVRVSTHPRALERPLTVGTAWGIVEGWLERPNVWIPVPTDRHRPILAAMLEGSQATANDVPDAHLAALAVEWGLELLSADRDFGRYPGLRWRDPLAGA
ncbi:MAG TPA: TA system VapC family ribonuclease toxin [Candidatus Binatia bacterium]|nr:TA system VapC family ribonuclease toxin [Candidatus Binatia bacterium]